jgi:hypothetical protein
MRCKDSKCSLAYALAVFGALAAIAGIVVVIVKFVLKNGRNRYCDCYHCECDDSDDDDFEEDGDDDFVDEDDESEDSADNENAEI